jgi:hypothetical protein
MIAVPVWVAVVLMVVGGGLWLADMAKKTRQRQQARAARARLQADVAAPQVSNHLPYGLSDQGDGEE